MNRKFQRACKLEIGVDPNAKGEQFPLTIPPEFTVEFEVRREALASAQEATFRIYNLGPVTRDKVFVDVNTYATDEAGTAVRRRVKFFAGYGDFKPLIFNGYIRSAVSYRNGVDFITEIQCYDGGEDMAQAYVAHTMGGAGATTTFEDALKFLNTKLPGTTGAPIIGEWPKTVTTERGLTLVGSVWNLTQTYSGGTAIIDNSQLKVLNEDEAIRGEIAVISSDTGLLGTPRRGLNRIEVTMLFEPRFTLLQVVDLQSETWKTVNRTYQVAGFTHRGTISPVVAGDCTTEVILYGPSQFKIIEGKAVMS